MSLKILAPTVFQERLEVVWNQNYKAVAFVDANGRGGKP
jgi:hypothetical protein